MGCAGSKHAQNPAASPKSRGDVAAEGATPRFVTDPAVGLKRFDGDGASMGWKARTVPQALQEKVARHGDLPAYRVKLSKDAEAWTSWTWAQYQQEIFTCAKALMHVGVGTGDAVNILAANAPQWFFAAMGAVHAGGMGVGLYITNSPAACEYQIAHSKSKVVFVDNNMQLAKIQAIRKNCPTLTHVVHWGADFEAAEGVLSFTDFMALGAETSDEDLKARVEALDAFKCCYLSYTSGTTANPKGVMYSHDSLLYGFNRIFAKALADCRASGVDLGLEERSVSYLPCSHIAGNVDLLGVLAMPEDINTVCHFAFPDAMQGTLGLTLKDVEPTLFVGVPRVFEKVMAGLKQALAGNPKLAEAPPAMLAAIVGLGKVKHALVGAAPLQLPAFEFFKEKVGVHLNEICGMTENTACQHLNTLTEHRFGTVGKAVPGTEIKLADETKEICCRGRNIMMGYLYDDAKTEAAIDADGWLHTGDVGKVDADGFCAIVGRIKELIITAGGENIPPVALEDAVRKAAPALSNVMAVGDRQKFMTCVVTVPCKPDGRGGWLDELDGAACAVDTSITKASEVAASEAWKAYIDNALLEANATLISRAAQIKKWAVLPTDFKPVGEDAELTPTLKLKREVVHKKYADVIHGLYGEDYIEMPWIPSGNRRC